MDSLGIYIHIPFCVKKCNYCDFLSWPAGKQEQDRYTEYLVREISMWDQFYRRDCENGEEGVCNEVDSIFIGGGTPSILSVKNLQKIMKAVRHHFQVDPSAEITIECNPGTVDLAKFRAYRGLGINRLSIGVQSVVDGELKQLGRIHSFEEAKNSFCFARKAGFTNINVDLMSAIPGQTPGSYQKTLDEIVCLRPEHISAYSLIIEEGTPFYDRYHDMPPVDEETDRQMYSLTKKLLAAHGYERYEISNYAKKGYSCRHNLKYWSDGQYIGFGPGAASKVANVRYKNETLIKLYEERIENGTGVSDVEEILQRKDQMSEFFILGLRRTSGVSVKEFEERFLADVDSVYGKQIRKFVHSGLLIREGERLYLSDKGLDLSNHVFCGFI